MAIHIYKFTKPYKILNPETKKVYEIVEGIKKSGEQKAADDGSQYIRMQFYFGSKFYIFRVPLANVTRITSSYKFSKDTTVVGGSGTVYRYKKGDVIEGEKIGDKIKVYFMNPPSYSISGTHIYIAASNFQTAAPAATEPVIVEKSKVASKPSTPPADAEKADEETGTDEGNDSGFDYKKYLPYAAGVVFIGVIIYISFFNKRK